MDSNQLDSSIIDEVTAKLAAQRVMVVQKALFELRTPSRPWLQIGIAILLFGAGQWILVHGSGGSMNRDVISAFLVGFVICVTLIGGVFSVLDRKFKAVAELIEEVLPQKKR